MVSYQRPTAQTLKTWRTHCGCQTPDKEPSITTLGKGDSGVQSKRAEKRRVLPAEGHLGKKLLLLAPEAAQSGGGNNGVAAGTAGIHSCMGGYVADSVPGRRADTARRCEHGRRYGNAAVNSVAMIDLSKVRN